MATATINVRVDMDIKRRVEQFCKDVGMNVSTAINLFFNAMLNQRKLPFEVAPPEDPFYKGANWRHVMEGIRAFESGKPGIVKTMEELEAMAQ